MAEQKVGRKKTFPRMPTKNWWDLRARFRQSIPAKVEPNYLQAILGLDNERSAGNLLGPLRTLGIIDDDNKPTELAADWRDDDTYGKACETMRKSIYPQGLLDAHPGPNPDPSGVAKWISRETRVGEGAAKGMAAIYVLLTQADPAGQTQRTATPKPSGNKGERKRGAKTAAPQAKTTTRTDALTERKPTGGGRGGPSLHVDVQVHVPADATPELIDQIFASMAKHFGDQS